MSFARSHPFLGALVVGALACGGLFAAEHYLGKRLLVARLGPAAAPVLDGDTSDPAWLRARPVTVLTAHGGDFGGSGESRIQVRALHDDRYLYMAVVWEDPTRSLDLLPLIKQDGHWHEAGQSNGVQAGGVQSGGVQSGAGPAEAAPTHYDDRLAIMLAPSGRALIGAAIHLGQRPLPDAPPPLSGRGLHFTGPGTMIDIWQWHAALGAANGPVENLHLGPPHPVTAAQRASHVRYMGGIEADRPVTRLNYTENDGSHCGSVQPLRLPRFDPAEVTDLAPAGTGKPALPAPEATILPVSATEPYSKAADARIPDGTVIPGLLLPEAPPAAREIEAHGKWDGGYWVLELRRPLAGGAHDQPVKTGMMMWFAAFDHAQTRHSYHLRPLILEMQP